MNVTLSAQRTEPNTHEMVVIHRIFRREFRLLAGAVRRTPNGDARRVAPIAEHIEFCLTELATSLSLLSDALAEHLDEEEAHILPLVREHITRGGVGRARPQIL